MRTLDANGSAPLRNRSDHSRWSVRTAVTTSRSTALVAALIVAIATAGTALHPDVPAATALTVIAMIPAVLVDVLTRRLPNRLVGGAAVAGAVAAAASMSIGVELRLLDGVVGAVAMSAPLLIVHLVSPASMGFGDVKAALVFGAAVGLIDPVLPVVALAAGSIGAAVHGLATRSRTVAFGPGLLGGTAFVLLFVASSVTFESEGHHDIDLHQPATRTL